MAQSLITWEIVNPSDPLTMLAPSLHVAAVAIVCVSTHLGVCATIDGKELSSPVMFGWEEWFESEGIDVFAWLRDPNRLREMAAALDSVCLGSANDRADFDDAMRAITDEQKRAEFIRSRNNRRRSSLNDIESACHNTAAQIRDRIAKIES